MVEARILEKGCFPFWGLIDIFLLYRTLIRHEYSFTQGPVMTLPNGLYILGIPNAVTQGVKRLQMLRSRNASRYLSKEGSIFHTDAVLSSPLSALPDAITVCLLLARFLITFSMNASPAL